MKYYIDGYNFIFRHPDFKKNLQSQREDLIRDLNEKAELLHLSLVIVFDAYHQAGEEITTHYKQIEIVYTAENETADNYILRQLNNITNPKQYTLVTSDNDLSRKAKFQQVNTLTTEAFINWISKKYRNKLSRPSKPKKLELPSPSIIKKEPIAHAHQDSILIHYEKIFSEKFKEANHSDAESQKSKNTQISKKSESDYARWLRIFESKDKKKSPNKCHGA